MAGILVKHFDADHRGFSAGILKILYDLNPLVQDKHGAVHYVANLVDHYGWESVRGLAPESVQYMIRLGQSARAHVNESVWIWNIFKRPLDPGRVTIVTGVRQPNEVDAILERGGQMWKIIRPGTTDLGMDGLLKDVLFDQVIVNDGTLEDLEREVLAAMDEERWA